MACTKLFKVWQLYQALFCRDPYRFGSIRNAEFSENCFVVVFDCALAQTDGASYLFIRQAVCDEIENRAFPVIELGITEIAWMASTEQRHQLRLNAVLDIKAATTDSAGSREKSGRHCVRGQKALRA